MNVILKQYLFDAAFDFSGHGHRMAKLAIVMCEERVVANLGQCDVTGFRMETASPYERAGIGIVPVCHMTVGSPTEKHTRFSMSAPYSDMHTTEGYEYFIGL